MLPSDRHHERVPDRRDGGGHQSGVAVSRGVGVAPSRWQGAAVQDQADEQRERCHFDNGVEAMGRLSNPEVISRISQLHAIVQGERAEK